MGVLSVNGGTQLHLDLTYRPQSLLIDAWGILYPVTRAQMKFLLFVFLYIQVAQAHDLSHSEVHGSHILTRQQIIKQQLGLIDLAKWDKFNMYKHPNKTCKDQEKKGLMTKLLKKN